MHTHTHCWLTDWLVGWPSSLPADTQYAGLCAQITHLPLCPPEESVPDFYKRTAHKRFSFRPLRSLNEMHTLRWALCAYIFRLQIVTLPCARFVILWAFHTRLVSFEMKCWCGLLLCKINYLTFTNIYFNLSFTNFIYYLKFYFVFTILKFKNSKRYTIYAHMIFLSCHDNKILSWFVKVYK